MPIRYKIILYGLSVFFISTTKVESHSLGPINIEIWTGGDDDYTQELKLKLNEVFMKTKKFRLNEVHNENAVKISIDSNVEWEKIGNKIRIHYKVLFLGDGDRQLGESVGYCWKKNMTVCAHQVVLDAERDLN